MREQLTQYVQLLFAGTENTDEIRQEILQNTLDRYDDLIDQGKSPEAAYRLAISGIGDINEIIGNNVSTVQPQSRTEEKAFSITPVWKKVLRAIAICTYIISPIPLFVLSELGMDTIGLCGTLGIIAVATAMIVLTGGKGSKASESHEVHKPESELQKAIGSIIGILGLCIYLAISFATGAWWITWLVFPIMGAVKGLVNACIDLKEVKNRES